MPFGIEPKDIAIFVAGAVLALLLGYIFYKLGRQRKTLMYSVDEHTLINPGKSWPDEIVVKFGERDVKGELKRVRVYVWNAGNQPIVRSDLATKSPPAFRIGEGTILLSAKVLDQSRAANDVILNALEPQFEFLNESDGFVVEFYADVGERRSLIWFKGDIVGGSEPVQRDFGFTEGYDGAGFMLLGSATFFGLFLTGAYAVGNAIWQDSLITIWRVIGILIFVPASLLLLGLTVFAFVRLFGSKIPKELRGGARSRATTLTQVAGD